MSSPDLRRHLLGLREASPETISSILETAARFAEVGQRDIKKVPALRGRSVVNLFMEPSTRTRMSFELAEKRLSAEVLNFSASSSSLSKGESFKDTALTIDAMGPDIIVVRHRYVGAADYLAELTSASIINAGDGAHEHPTQALLDLFTMRQRWGSFEGRHVLIVGDILHSRVVRSNIFALRAMGVRVTLCSPPTMSLQTTLGGQVTHTTDLDAVLPEADAVMMLRVQFERQSGVLFTSPHEYYRRFGLTPERLDRMKPDAFVMHPGPMNRGIEIAPEVADSDRAVILDQVEVGIAVRMAVLYWVTGTPEVLA